MEFNVRTERGDFVTDTFQSAVSTLDDVSLAIVRERNQEIREIAQEASMLSEIMHTLSGMLTDQGEQLDQIQAHVDTAVVNAEEATTTLSHASTYKEKTRGLIFDILTIAIGTGVGCLGFLAGPWVGLPLLLGGIVTSSTIVAARRALSTLERTEK